MTRVPPEPALTVEVVYARPDRQVQLALDLQAGASVREAIEASGILEVFPEIRLDREAVGIFGRLVRLDERPRNGDRIEIYRPLSADPRTRRRRKATAARGTPARGRG